MLSPHQAKRICITSNITPTFADSDMRNGKSPRMVFTRIILIDLDCGEFAIRTVSPGSAELVAVCRGTTENRAIWKRLVESDATYYFPRVVEAVEDIAVILLTSDTALHLRPDLLYATYTVVGGFTTELRYVTEKSLEPAAYACDVEPDYCMNRAVALLTAVQRCWESDEEESQMVASEVLCRRYGKIKMLPGREESEKSEPKLWEFTKQTCRHCGITWEIHQ